MHKQLMEVLYPAVYTVFVVHNQCQFRNCSLYFGMVTSFSIAIVGLVEIRMQQFSTKNFNERTRALFKLVNKLSVICMSFP